MENAIRCQKLKTLELPFELLEFNDRQQSIETGSKTPQSAPDSIRAAGQSLISHASFRYRKVE
jgi:hypothetical protein